MTGDDLVLMGTAGLVALIVAAGIFVYLALNLLLLEVHAMMSGDLRFVALSLAALLIAGAAYWGTGLWLRRTGRI